MFCINRLIVARSCNEALQSEMLFKHVYYYVQKKNLADNVWAQKAKWDCAWSGRPQGNSRL